jgi:hypothetical protein
LKTRQPQSEGVRRIVLTSSIVLPVLWLIYVLGRIAESDLRRDELGYVAIVVVVFGIFFSLIPRVIPRFAYWIRDGFSLDKRLTSETKQPRSEGVRSIVFACSIALSGYWMFSGCFYLAGCLLSRSRSQFSSGLFVTIIGSVVSYFIPKWISKFAYWIKDGFDLDKKRDDTA